MQQPLQQFQADDCWPSCPRRRWPVAATRRSIANMRSVSLSAEREQPRFSRVSRYIVSSNWKFGSTTECASNADSYADSYEHTAVEVPHLVSSRAVGMPTCVGCFARMTGGHHVLMVAAMKHSIANTMRMCFSAEGERPKF